MFRHLKHTHHSTCSRRMRDRERILNWWEDGMCVPGCILKSRIIINNVRYFYYIMLKDSDMTSCLCNKLINEICASRDLHTEYFLSLSSIFFWSSSQSHNCVFKSISQLCFYFLMRDREESDLFVKNKLGWFEIFFFFFINSLSCLQFMYSLCALFSLSLSLFGVFFSSDRN